ncbi:TonB-dependent receptor [Carboxylicivirga sp. N1Y90]|uniref:TonB-dependent receptor n=1 Tax=Carboxylicivirga fragile TaxID=3417571 RepID=UPI003D34DFBA|nr:TonB-dependent receptor [Marinilabiliaceae bacterium N1Y90]
MKRSLLLLFLLIQFFATVDIQAQKRLTITGHVSDTLNTPLPFVNVVILEVNEGSVSNEKGHFSFQSDVTPPFTIAFTCIGFEEQRINITSASDLKNLNIKLNSKQEELEQVEVEGQIRDQSFSKIDHKLANQLPDAGGGNIEGLVKSQMGVASNNELSSQYRVRGGNYDENLVYVNDIEIYRPFLIRSGQQEGLSFINPNLISSLKFSPGGFEAQYGDKMSSVLDVQYKQPKELGGSISASLLGASGHIEGSSKDQRFKAIAGARYKTNKYLLGTLDVSGDYQPTFFDVQSLISYQINSKLRLEALAYYAQNIYDFVPVDRETVFGTINEAKTLKIYFEGQEKDLFQTGLGALSLRFNPQANNQYKLTFMGYRSYEEVTYDILGEYWLQDIESLDGSTPDPSEGIQNVGVGGNLEHARNNLLGVVQNVAVQGKHQLNDHLISWEAKYQYERFDDYINEWEMRDSAGYSTPYTDLKVDLFHTLNADLETNSNRITVYAQDEFKWETQKGILLINAGVRANYWDFNNELLISPRLNILYHPDGNKNTRYRLATGIYYQSPFYREMRTPEGTLNEDIKAQKSVQVVGGYDRIFSVFDRPFKFTAEAYYKHLTNLNPYQIDNVQIRYSGKNNAKGYATGLDLKINGEFVEGIESWANLSIMKTEEDILDDYYIEKDEDGTETIFYPGYIPRPSDQRVNFSLFFQDYLPRNPTFRVNLSLHFGTGLPFGPPSSPRYMATHRMPSYRRVDIGFSKDLMNFYKRQFPKNNAVKDFWIGLEVFNLFNISNTISYYWVRDVHNRQYAVPNYLTSRRINLKLHVGF